MKLLKEIKEIEYNGEKFKVGFQSYAYSYSRFVINGEVSSVYEKNESLLDIDIVKTTAKKAIEEYIARRVANKNFKEWNGKLD